jgi:hypothetical protein
MVLSLKETGYLNEEGWFRAFDEGKPMDKEGNPIPWFSYPAIDFLKDRLNSELLVFEYGSGNSTLFFSARVKKIISIETNKLWFDSISKKLPHNASIYFCDLSKDNNKYNRFIKEANAKYDIIIVDAENRNEVILNLHENLKDDGIIILDNSDRKEYSESISYLRDKGFSKLDFWGITAGYFNKTCTTFFYKQNNCLGI